MAKKTNKKNPAAVALGSIGGKRRALKLTAKRRSEIALIASRAAAVKRSQSAA